MPHGVGACSGLVQIQLGLAPIAFYRPPEDLLPALRTNIAGLLIPDPLFSAELPPIGDGTQDDLFADGHGKLLNISAGKFIALMAPDITFLQCTGPDLASPAVQKQVIGQATSAAYIADRKICAVSQCAFPGDLPLVEPHQALFEFLVIAAMCDVNGTDSAIEAAWSNKIRVYCHGSPSWIDLLS